MKVAAGAAVGTVAVVAAPAVLATVGFTSAGVAAGSIAAALQVDNNPYVLDKMLFGISLETLFYNIQLCTHVLVYLIACYTRQVINIRPVILNHNSYLLHETSYFNDYLPYRVTISVIVNTDTDILLFPPSKKRGHIALHICLSVCRSILL